MMYVPTYIPNWSRKHRLGRAGVCSSISTKQCSIFGHLHKWKLANTFKILSKWCEILPNLVTLAPKFPNLATWKFYFAGTVTAASRTNDSIIFLLLYADNTRLLCKGKYHCTTDLLFDCFEFSCYAKVQLLTCSAKSKPVKQEVIRTMILPLTKKLSGLCPMPLR